MTLAGSFAWDRLCIALFAPRIFASQLHELASLRPSDATDPEPDERRPKWNTTSSQPSNVGLRPGALRTRTPRFLTTRRAARNANPGRCALATTRWLTPRYGLWVW